MTQQRSGPHHHEFRFGSAAGLDRKCTGLWPSSMKLFGSGRTKEREGIKKQNGMSALIDTELDRGKWEQRGERRTEQRGDKM